MARADVTSGTYVEPRAYRLMDGRLSQDRLDVAGIPALPGIDSTVQLLANGYLFGERGFDRVQGDAFHTRLLGRRVTVLRGLEAVRFFYEGGRFDRSHGSVPRSAVHLLQDEGSVQTLEGSQHAERKILFLGLLGSEEARQELLEAVNREWIQAATGSAGVPQPMLEFTTGVLARAVQRWMGIAPESVSSLSAGELASMVNNAGAAGVPNWAARARRVASERKARELIRGARQSQLASGRLRDLAFFEEGGTRLPEEVAAIELLNILRPTVAVARYLTFAALAVYRNPRAHQMATGTDLERRSVAEEVRRFFPFFPVIGGKATRDLEWQGAPIREGSWVMVDLYGTDHHSALWESPRRFMPERHLNPVRARSIVAQGTGDLSTTHHCPGQSLTSDLIALGLQLLTRGPAYAVPPQDFRVSLRRLPTAPQDGFVVSFI